MDRVRQRQEVDRNYDAFVRMLGEILPRHRDEHALMRDCEVIDYFQSAGEAYRAGLAQFADEVFSIQEVTDEPIDLGFFSHVGN